MGKSVSSFHTARLILVYSGFTSFSTIMYESFGFNEWQTILYGLPRNGMFPSVYSVLGLTAVAVGFVVFIAVALYIRYYQNMRLWIMILSCIISFVGLLVMSLLPDSPQYKWVKWGMFMMTVVFAFAIFLAWSLSTVLSLSLTSNLSDHATVPSNVAGGTKKTVVSSMTFIGYCVGNMVGSQVFKTNDAPRYVSGTVACCVAFGLEAILLLLWRFWYMYENRRRDRLAAESGLSKEEQGRLGRKMGEKDFTDWQNPHFRYSM